MFGIDAIQSNISVSSAMSNGRPHPVHRTVRLPAGLHTRLQNIRPTKDKRSKKRQPDRIGRDASGLSGLLALVGAVLLSQVSSVVDAATNSNKAERKLLYVAEPGIRNYLEYGGHGVLLFDIDSGHRFVKRIPAAGLDEKGKPLNVKGICANAATKRLYVSTTRTVTCFDIATDKILWEKAYEGGCDRLAVSPDGKVIYLPSLEKAHWQVVDALTGDVIRKIVTNSGAHNTIIGLDGQHAYLAGLASPLLRVTDTKTHEVIREVGPFGNFIRPFTVNGRGTLCFVNINDLLGFEIGDLRTGKMRHRVEVPGYQKG